ncbi:non-ribosomal peptide synthetase [Gluconacetobacter diazotrophicus]|nr:non-ribosomal peptide synthetase [Gluconacetobacter diazotrophicus]
MNHSETDSASREVDVNYSAVHSTRAHEGDVEFALSEPQHEMWLSTVLQPEQTYNIAGFLEIRGKIEPEIFRQACHRVTSEATAVRARFVETESGIIQSFQNASSLKYHYADLSDRDDADQFVRTWMDADARNTCDPEEDRLYTLNLFRIARERFIFYQRYHHLLMDGQSIGLISGRLAELYRAYAANEPTPTPWFGDFFSFLSADAAYHQSNAETAGRAFWRDYLAGWEYPGALLDGLPTTGIAEHQRRFTLSTAERVAFVDLVRRLGSQFSTGTIACVMVFLHRISGFDDIAISMPVTGRTRETRTMPGFVSNVVPLRTTFTPSTTFADVVRNVARHTRRILRHSRVRGERIARDMLPKGIHSFGPSVNVIDFDNRVKFGGEESIGRTLISGPHEDYAITFCRYPSLDGTDFEIIIDSARWPNAGHRIASLERIFRSVIRQIIARPNACIADIDVLDPNERTLLLETWNEVAAPLAPDLCLHEAFEEQVARDPAAIALTFGQQTVTYGELNTRANRLAHHLIALGIEPDMRVGLCAARSIEMVVGLLAILKAGGAYVPLDPAAASSRLGLILADAAPEVVILDPAGRNALGAETLDGLTVIDLHADRGDWTSRPDTNPDTRQSDFVPKNRSPYCSPGVREPKHSPHYGHQDMPFEKLVEVLNPARAQNHHPLFQVMLALENTAETHIALPALDVAYLPAETASAKFDLTFTFAENGSALDGEIEYDTDLFDQASVERIAQRLQRVLDAMAQSADTHIADIDVLDPNERILLLETWNETSYPVQFATLPELFEQQVQRTPEAIALRCGSSALSYLELNTRANQIAYGLISRGIGPEDRVALCLPPSNELIIALLGIVKAGAAYVPLDPNYPPDRLQFIIADCAPDAIITAESAVRKGGFSSDHRILFPDSPELMPRSDIRIEISPDNSSRIAELSVQNAAYIIYTSGSTGTPKGVVVTHRGLASHTACQRHRFNLGTDSRVLLFASINFDSSVGQICSALLTGGTLVVVDRRDLLDRGQFTDLLHRYAINYLDTTPAFLANISPHDVPEDCVINVGGEALSLDLATIWFQRHQLFNSYGPTETTVDAIVSKRIKDARQALAIGRPVFNARIYILDAGRRPAPLGVAGELYIGGAGVARGYLNRPDLTAERFLDDPFSPEPGARMYRTGDLARYLPDGNIEFLGRADQQVKIRGFRIEPGEIEARLGEQPGIRAAAVIAREDSPGDKRLVGYVVPDDDAALEPAALRRALGAVLPDYMVPAAILVLDALPLTPNGKLDRKALPAPDDSAFDRSEYVAPEGDAEMALAAIWQDLLGLSRVGRYDNFFELGGHSLLAVQMMERLRRIGLATQVRTLFGAPVLADLARCLGDSHIVVTPPNLIPYGTDAITPDMLPLIDLDQAEINRIGALVPGGIGNIQDIYALTPLQDGILFHHLLAERGDPYLLAGQMAFADREKLDHYLETIQTIVDRHDVLRTCFIWEGISNAAQVVLREANLSVTELKLDPTDGPVTDQLVRRFDPRVSRIDLGQPPLLRFAIARDEPNDRWILVEQLHHLIGDHSTLDVMNAEVLALLSQRPDALAPPQPFRNLVAQTRLGVPQAEHEAFFRDMLADMDEPTLPFGLADVHLDGAETAEATRMLPQALNDRLRHQARRLGVSLASLCHLAWGRVIAATSGRQDVVFGTVLFGRMDAGTGADRAMGLFINTLPLRLKLEAAGTEQGVRDTHAALAGLLRHEHASLSLARQCSAVPPATPLFSALLNYRHNQNIDRSADAFATLLDGVEFLGADERTNYPVTLSVEDFGTSLGLTTQVVAPLDPERICGYMQRALEGMLEALENNPQTPIERIDVLDPNERTLLLETWNDTAAPYPANFCIHQMVERQVYATPGATAVVCGEDSITYADLNARANRLAHHLIALGVQPDQPVAICLDRSVAMVVGLLAILKAGGAYLPLDPAYPTARLCQILDDARPAILLLDDTGRRAVGDHARDRIRIIDLHADAATWHTRSDTDPDPRQLGLTSRNVAYVIYTSGSTGVPKGVPNEHRALINRLTWMQNAYCLIASDAVLQKTSFGFDVSVWEFFWTLMAGARMVLAAPNGQKDAAYLSSLIEQQQVTTLHFVPSMLELFLEEGKPEQCGSLRRVICSGEALPAGVLQRCHSLLPDAGIHNLYGPTEAAIDVTAWSCLGDVGALSSVPIGRPIANTRIYILDNGQQLVPGGVAGELYIGGAGVARGYLNRPDLTAERFLDDPFSPEPGARMYRTGDLARYLPDGNIEFLGRADQQVKIRGFRIEPGEIEARLGEQPGIRAAAVIAREDSPGDKRLVGYVVPDDTPPGPATCAGIHILINQLVPPRMRAARRLHALARRSGASLFMVLQAGLAILLGKLGAGDDIAIGSPIAGRTESALDDLVGFFVNTLVLRTDLAGNPTVAELLARVRETSLAAYGHQDMPFEKLVEVLNPARAQNHHPLFQVMLALENTAETHIALPALDVAYLPAETASAKFDLTFTFAENGSALDGEIEYDTDLFDQASVERIAQRLQRVLDAMAQSADTHIADIDVLDPNERTLLLETWNEVAAPLAPDLCLHEAFEEQVARDPAAIALTFGQQTVTYGELNTRANRLAHHLIALGIEPDMRVGLCAARSIEMVVGLLAILKAGGAYVPLDPAAASSRLGLILADAAPEVVILDPAGRNALGAETLDGLTVIDLHADRGDWTSRPDTNPDTRTIGLRPENLAYIIYTSGSTGTPKGVMVEHAQVARLFDSTQAWFGFDAQDVWCLFHSFAFDFSVWELWGALRHGGRLVVVPHAVARSAAEFHRLVCEQGVTVLNQTPSAFKAFIDAQAEDGLTDQLRYVIFGGEALEPSMLRKWYAVRPDDAPRLVNMYGITETTVHVTYRPLTADDAEQTGSPIGCRIPDLRVYILDNYGQPVPLGMVGELYVGGAGVARGYLNRPDLTAERFLDDPFSPEPGARMYRTGDLARYLPDGNIEFLGRADQQVKIRGFRIEPGEIEARLGEQPGIRAAAVIAREDSPGDKRLVGYVVPDDDAALEPAALRRALGAVLPDYMVPAAILVLDALPLTPNGKLDRKALPAPDFTPAGDGRAPRTPQEAVLAALFAEILGVDRVGIDDSFFDLGGHSLLATRLVSRIRATLGADLPIRALFEAPTVTGLSERIDAGRGQSSRPALAPMARPPVLPLSFAQQRLWFLYQLEGPSPTYNMPLSLRLDGPLDVVAMQAALRDVVARHESLRTLFPEIDGIACQQILEPEDPRCRVPLDIREVDQTSLTPALAAEAARPIDVGAEPPIRATLFRLAPERHVMLVLLHHIASDGWSMTPFARDLARAYEARLAGRAPDLAPLPVQYADYTLWQRDLLGDAADPDSLFHQQVAYWRDALAGLPACIELPTDRPRPAVSSYRGAIMPVRLDAALRDRLHALARRSGASLFMVLQAGLAILLGKLGAGDDIAIGSPIAGRTESALDDLVGFFVNTLVLRTDLAGNPTVAELLARVRETSLAAYGHQDMPFEKLVEVLNPARAQNHHPLFQVMLALENTAETHIALPALDVAYLPAETASAKFDLTFTFAENGSALDGEIEYDTDLFDQASVERIAQRLQRVLDAMAQSADTHIADIDVLDPNERILLLETWNNTAAPYPADLCLHQMVEAQVCAAPDTTAVLCGDDTLTYADLNARANRLAHHLIALGVQPDQPVAICLDRSVAMVVGLLAILKAGGAYLPLDPAYPTARLCQILDDARPAILLLDDTGRRAVGDHARDRIRIIDLHADAATWHTRSDTDPDPRQLGLTSRNVAYVIYTSGSTGVPKGVAVEHRNIVNHTAWQTRIFGFDATDRVLQRTSISFDAAGWEVWTPLACGAATILYPGTNADGLSRIFEYAASMRVTTLQGVPSFFSAINTADAVGSWETLRYVFCGGEEADLKTVYELEEKLRAPFFNLYGPTETTIDALFWPFKKDGSLSRKAPIGRPVANTRIYILDNGQQLVPGGVAGELYIGGAGVARGYLNRPDLTAERFLDDPFSPEPGARMYRTGDLARYLPDGNIEFLGRADQQVKIRGFRIEPGEIEARLGEQPGIRAAAVIAREDSPGDKRLVGYVVPDDDAALEPAALRRALGAVLPDYMVPAAILVLDALPLTPNGKLDRKALPAPDFTPAGDGRAPRTPQEAVLAALFAEILGVDRVGIDDSFFDLGGHSLLATRLVSRIRATLDVDLPIRALFEVPTVAGLSGRIDDGHDAGGSNLIALRKSGSLSPLFCLHGGFGLPWPYRNLLSNIDADRPVYAFQARGFEDGEVLPACMEDLASDYVAQIRNVQPQGPYHLLGWSFGAVAAHAIATRLQGHGENVAILHLLDGYPVDDIDKQTAREDREFTIAIKALMREYGIENVDAQMETKMAQVFRNNTMIMYAYHPDIFDGDIHLLRAVPDGSQPPDETTSLWLPYASGSVRITDIDATHSQMLAPVPARTIANAIQGTLDGDHTLETLFAPRRGYQ